MGNYQSPRTVMSVQTISTLKTLSEISRYVTYLTVFGFIVKIGALFSILLISINSNNYIVVLHMP